MSVEINGDSVARHISNLRRIHNDPNTTSSIRLDSTTDRSEEKFSDNDNDLEVIQVYRWDEPSHRPTNVNLPIASTGVDLPVLRRSSRQRAVPVRLNDYVLD